MPYFYSIEYEPLLAAIYSFSIYMFFLSAAFLLIKFDFIDIKVAISPQTNRYGSLDGFRGLLAICVFVHHSFAAYGYFTTGKWDWSSSSILNHLGQTSVALFFMITGFLFTIKAMDKKIDWKALYLSRIARLMPLYAVIVFVVFILVFWLSNWILNVSILRISKEFLQWLLFVCFGRPDINNYKMTWTLIAGVNWSLKFEVFFYILAVPILHFFYKKTTLNISLLMSIVSFILLLIYRFYKGEDAGSLLYVSHFLGGIISAYLYSIPRIKLLIKSRYFRFIGLISIFLLLLFSNNHGYLSVLLTVIIFCSVIGGFSFLGILNSTPAIWLGDISYGVYLIHGLTLWCFLSVFYYLNILNKIDLVAYYGVMCVVSTVVLLLASMSYVMIERPVMIFVKKINKLN